MKHNLWSQNPWKLEIIPEPRQSKFLSSTLSLRSSKVFWNLGSPLPFLLPLSSSSLLRHTFQNFPVVCLGLINLSHTIPLWLSASLFTRASPTSKFILLRNSELGVFVLSWSPSDKEIQMTQNPLKTIPGTWQSWVWTDTFSEASLTLLDQESSLWELNTTALPSLPAFFQIQYPFFCSHWFLWKPEENKPTFNL